MVGEVIHRECHLDDYFTQYADGEWVKVDDIFVGEKGKNKFFETSDFLIDSALPMNLIVQLCIRIAGTSINVSICCTVK